MRKRIELEPINGLMPKKPKGGNWQMVGWVDVANGYMFCNAFGIQVISAVQLYKGKREYHVSITDKGERIPASLVESILDQFEASQFEEDNHVPNGKVRNFFYAADEPQKECGCKENETPVVQGDYIWRPDLSEQVQLG